MKTRKIGKIKKNKKGGGIWPGDRVQHKTTQRTGTVTGKNLHRNKVTVKYNNSIFYKINKIVEENIHNLIKMRKTPRTPVCKTCGIHPHLTNKGKVAPIPLPHGYSPYTTNVEIEAGIKKNRKNSVKTAVIDRYFEDYVEQGSFKIVKIGEPLITFGLITCSALMMDINGTHRLLAHIDGIPHGQSKEEIDKMIDAIHAIPGEKSITNIKIWAGVGGLNEEGAVRNDPTKYSMHIVVDILKRLDAVDVRRGKGIFYKGTDERIIVEPTCLAHYVGTMKANQKATPSVKEPDAA